MKENTTHKKHSKIEKPKGGQYHRNEWSIIGAPCDIIDELAETLNKVLKAHATLGYLNASHTRTGKKEKFNASLLQKKTHRLIKTDQEETYVPYRQIFNHLDLMLINGNHFNGSKQIVLINEKKKESLSRKLDRLTDIRIILLEKSSDDIYDFVLAQIKDPAIVKIFRLSEIEKICNTILADLKKELPPIWGLVLSGGKSKRMGEDKGALIYHELPQREYEASLLNQFCGRTLISCRKNQDELIETNFEKLYDSFTGLGPFGGILSAFRFNPNIAWLTVACDLPYLDKETIQKLVNSRNSAKIATCYYNPETEFPEPLITLWEPRAYPILLNYLGRGYSCPRKVLINEDIELIEMDNPIKMKNANTPEEKSDAIQYLRTTQI